MKMTGTTVNNIILYSVTFFRDIKCLLEGYCLAFFSQVSNLFEEIKIKLDVFFFNY